MPKSGRRWHRDSIFGEGPRQPIDRERRARFYFLLKAHRRAHHLSPLSEHIGISLIRHLSTSGRCDPSHDRINWLRVSR
jgi:hypothetical protein